MIAPRNPGARFGRRRRLLGLAVARAARTAASTGSFASATIDPVARADRPGDLGGHHSAEHPPADQRRGDHPRPEAPDHHQGPDHDRRPHDHHRPISGHSALVIDQLAVWLRGPRPSNRPCSTLRQRSST